MSITEAHRGGGAHVRVATDGMAAAGWARAAGDGRPAGHGLQAMGCRARVTGGGGAGGGGAQTKELAARGRRRPPRGTRDGGAQRDVRD
jgi:hypothetical protein